LLWPSQAVVHHRYSAREQVEQTPSGAMSSGARRRASGRRPQLQSQTRGDRRDSGSRYFADTGGTDADHVSTQIGLLCVDRGRFRHARGSRSLGGYLSGHPKTQVTLRDRLSSAFVLGWQSSRLPTDHVRMAKVSCRARGHDPVRGMSARSDRYYSPGSLQMGSPFFRPGVWCAVRDRPPEVGGRVRRSSYRHR
jgi:hypothetical protein